jgi:lysozyme family protein|tara:strand:+ start:373 stop:867 length:495 start_codon:yes stop_codon:yes gene_type:complete
MKFYQVIGKIIKLEGGAKVVNDKDDRGGETKFGISKRSHPEYDIKNITEDTARDIYKEMYWKPCKAEKLPESLRAEYFDMVVTSGQGNAIKTLQRACNSSPRCDNLAVDGRIGPMTIKESQKLKIERFRAYRTLYYAQLVTAKPTQEKFWVGWYNRTHSWMTPQ